MATTIVNVKVQNIRPQYLNLKEWMNDDNNVYIGRAGIVFIDGERFPKQSSEWCNPYKITDELSRDECLDKYAKHLVRKLIDKKAMRKFMLLKGKNLGCWCHPEACHGDVIKIFLDEL